MAIRRAPRRAGAALALAVLVAGSSGAAAAESGPPSRLVLFLPGTASADFPGTVYADHPFDAFVWIADAGGQLVKDGTSALVTLAVDPGTGSRPVLSCPAGLTVRSNTSGPNAGLAAFTECTFDQDGEVTLSASASDVVSTVVPTPTLTPQVGAPLRVLPSVEAPQESISVTFDGTTKPYVVLPYGRSASLRIAFTQHGSNQPLQLQEGSRTTSAWRVVANLTTDADGIATFVVRPSVSAWYRVVYLGSPELAAGRSRRFTALVQAVASQRPVHATARVIDRGSTVRFTTTVRPVIEGLAPMKVGFELYHRVGGRWRLASLRTRPVDAAGVARITITFAAPGDWYVRSYAKGQLAPNAPVERDGFLAAIGGSERTPIARFRVR